MPRCRTENFGVGQQEVGKAEIKILFPAPPVVTEILQIGQTRENGIMKADFYRHQAVMETQQMRRMTWETRKKKRRKKGTDQYYKSRENWSRERKQQENRRQMKEEENR